MKKIILVLTLVLALGLGSMFVYATETPAVTSEEKEANEWFEERMEYKNDQIEKAFKDGEITQEQYDAWVLHLDEMKEFHKENGFINGGGFGAGCHGAGRGNGFGGMMRGGFNGGFGGGMMRGGFNSFNNNNNN